MSESSQTVVPILAYCVSSITMTLTNKFVLSGFKFHMAFLVLAIQSFGSVALLMLASKLGGGIKYRALNKRDMKTWLPVAVLQVFMLYTGAKALQHLNVPLFTVFKNLTIIAVAYRERFVFGTSVTKLMLISFGLMVLSSIVGAYNDIVFNFYGYMWMAMNCFASASFVIVMRKTISSVNFKDFDTVYYNNAMTLVMFLVLSLVSEQWSDFLAFYSDSVNSAELRTYLFSNLISGISAFAISYTSAWCLRTTSSTTYSMVGALNKLPIAVFAMLFFPDPVTLGGVLAVIFGFGAGLVYTQAKNNLKKETPQGQQVLPPPASSTGSNNEEKAFVDKPMA
ncbi:GDP-mannose transporter [Smittium mucronatum]|uniref:GDP-mannose transporter n=1 Tax=Smittium mucronatum TaxID=133383 RepID=A0A1R0H6K9_9FUNG|nr:GDP-mannose transporter [Smittium mucronatum]